MMKNFYVSVLTSPEAMPLLRLKEISAYVWVEASDVGTAVQKGFVVIQKKLKSRTKKNLTGSFAITFTFPEMPAAHAEQSCTVEGNSWEMGKIVRKAFDSAKSGRLKGRRINVAGITIRASGEESVPIDIGKIQVRYMLPQADSTKDQ
jgi:hypothetical protein